MNHLRRRQSGKSPKPRTNHSQPAQKAHSTKNAPPSFTAFYLPPEVLAAYYNDARLNVLACLNDIRSKVGRKVLENEDQIESAIKELGLITAPPEEQANMIKHLHRSFGFLKVLMDNTAKTNQAKDLAVPLPRYYEQRLTWVLALLNDLRNTFVHPTDPECQLERVLQRKLYFLLNRVYDASFHEVKKRFSHSTASMASFMRCGRDGKAKRSNEFVFALCSDPINVPENAITPQSQVLYSFGHVLFCALFLEKSQSAELMSHFWEAASPTLQQQWTTEQRSIIREMIAVYRLHLPIQRLESTDTTIALTLDTLSELARCPLPLLESLSPEDQAKFRFEAAMASEVEEENEPEGASVLFARGRNERFPSLMMRFLDFDADNRLRFAIDLGQFHYHVRLKAAEYFTDQLARVRTLGQKILSYGRLHDLERATKPADWTLLENNYTQLREEAELIKAQGIQGIVTLHPYLIPTYPHYHYFPERIGFRLDHAEKPTNADYPDLNAHAAQQAIALPSPSAQTMQPQFWMSHEQLLHTTFYHYLWKTQAQGHTASRIDTLIRRYEAGMRTLVKKLAQGEPSYPMTRTEAQQWVDQCFNAQGRFAVPLSSLPQVVQHHLIQGRKANPLSHAALKQRIEHLSADTEQRLTALKSLLQSDKKRGQKGFKAIKCGVIGDFLADDFMRFQPVDSTKPDGGKLNSQQYQILQKTLAYYGAHLEQPPKISDLLEDCGLLAGSLAHPFLPQLGLQQEPNKYQGLLSFYEAYLIQRQRFLKQCTHDAKHWSLDRLPKWLGLRPASNLAQWLHELWEPSTQSFKQPLPLPDQFLYQPILTRVAEYLGLSPAELEAQGSQYLSREHETVIIPPSITWLLKRYLAQQGESEQAMYDYPRQHPLLDTWLDKRTKKFTEKVKHYLPEAARKTQVEAIRAYLKTPEPVVSKAAKSNTLLEKRAKLNQLLKAYKQDERALRHLVAQDKILYLYVRDYLDKLVLTPDAPKPQWSLQGIAHTLLNTTIWHELPIPQPKPKKNEPAKPWTARSLYHPSCKIRDLGGLSVLVRDRRLVGLLGAYGGYYPLSETQLHHDEIRAELASYRRTRVKIMALIHGLERAIIQTLGTIPERKLALKDSTLNEEQRAQLKQSLVEFGEGRHGDLLWALYQQTQAVHARGAGFSVAAFRQFRLIRNAFAHNQYPEAEDFPDLATRVRLEPTPDNPALHRKVAVRFAEHMERLCQPWFNYLQNSQR